ncbi:uncharacterized protein EI97DRAFT_431173 [Westerdykella ornata]|uniref:Uncharacterized protein n=1 Tax=Westerdykella ornata TaxID=318751 RepID=A0A6A6JS45_WESOR|nr:uncharacterized protein EI97DRAFT_431173 [Westerdykella ornata]KAF2278933.1 hypothetical protein EI97DRAFT_431173 [Westerdykella ornata]
MLLSHFRRSHQSANTRHHIVTSTPRPLSSQLATSLHRQHKRRPPYSCPTAHRTQKAQAANPRKKCRPLPAT